MKKRFPPPSHRAIPTRDKKQKRGRAETPSSTKASRKHENELREKETKRAQELSSRAKRENLASIDRTKLKSSGFWGATFGVATLEGKFYLDWPFTCLDCGRQQVWTGRQQKWWFEQMDGMIEQVAIRCRDCRIKERARRNAARTVHLEGLERKKAARLNLGNLKNKRRKRPGTW